MTVPPVMLLYVAVGALIDGPDQKRIYPPLVEGGPPTSTRDRELKEFQMLGLERWANLRAELARQGYTHTDAELGYLIGLEVCRAMLAMMPAAVDEGVTL
jgi:hypothetical protein